MVCSHFFLNCVSWPILPFVHSHQGLFKCSSRSHPQGKINWLSPQNEMKFLLIILKELIVLNCSIQFFLAIRRSVKSFSGFFHHESFCQCNYFPDSSQFLCDYLFFLIISPNLIGTCYVVCYPISSCSSYRKVIIMARWWTLTRLIVWSEQWFRRRWETTFTR